MKKYDNRSNICDIRNISILLKLRETQLKSFITEKYIRMSGMKKRLKMKRTRKALEETKEITAGKYGGTSYEFKHDVRTKSWNACHIYCE